MVQFEFSVFWDVTLCSVFHCTSGSTMEVEAPYSYGTFLSATQLHGAICPKGIIFTVTNVKVSGFLCGTNSLFTTRSIPEQILLSFSMFSGSNLTFDFENHVNV